MRTWIKLLHKQALHLAGIFKSLKSWGLLVSLASVSSSWIIKELQITGFMVNLLCSGRPAKLSVHADRHADRQMQKSDDNPFWWRSFSSYNRRENMKIAALASKFWRQSQIADFWSWETKWWCTLLLQSWIQLLERLVKPRALKWQQKRLADRKSVV